MNYELWIMDYEVSLKVLMVHNSWFIIKENGMKRLILIVAVLMAQWAVTASAQNILEQLQRDVPGQGTVTIHMADDVAALLSNDLANAKRLHSTTAEKTTLKKPGYRVQVYVGSNTRASKNEASKIAAEVKNKFPDLTVYSTFNPPRWLCRVGDFRTIEEADAVMRIIKKEGGFKEVSIVKDQIVLPIE